MLTTEEAARRLGVKVPTLYAYVSRGLLGSHRDPMRRGSLFELADIEGLAARSRGGRQTATRLATITTGVTQLDQDLGPIYRGRLATALAGGSSFEEVAEMLWQSEVGGDWSAPDLGPCPLTRTFDRLRWALVLAGATDPLRADLRPVAVARAARRATAALTDAVGPPPPGEAPDASIAARLTARLAPGAADVPDGRGQRGARPPGRSRAGHLDHGGTRRRVGAFGSVRRAAGRAGHAGRAVARRSEPAGLRAAGGGRAGRRRPGPRRRPARERPAAGIRPCRLQERRPPLRRVGRAGRSVAQRRAPRAGARGTGAWRPRTTCRWPIATWPSPRSVGGPGCHPTPVASSSPLPAWRAGPRTTWRS